jgi:hypothetical protein
MRSNTLLAIAVLTVGMYALAHAGAFSGSGSPTPVPRYTVGTLPTCNAGNHGLILAVTDATTPTYNGALTGGAAVEVPVYCNGTTWTSH